MKLCLLKTTDTNFFRKKSFLENKYDKYFFLGKNPMLGKKIESILNNKIDQIRYSKQFIRIQYNYRNDFIDFIDNNEKIDFGNKWWRTRLSGKNPWISFTYFRFCQILLVKEILSSFLRKNDSILIIFEEECVLKSVYELLSKNSNYNIHKIIHKDNSAFGLVFKGLFRRVVILPYLIYTALIFKFIFKSKINKEFLANKIFVFTFLDSRCFIDGNYKDPFLGKFLSKIKLNKNISIVPVLHDVTLKNFKIFFDWLNKNKCSVSFLAFQLKFIDLINIIKSFNFRNKEVNNSLLNININNLIKRERLEEWSEFSLQNIFIARISNEIKSTKHKKLILYPFENQIWERNMLDVLKKDSKIKIFGIQNAPSPKLSIRYFISKKNIKLFPLPDYLFVIGKISYNNLVEFYDKKILRMISSSRKIFKSKKLKKPLEKNIMVACSISTIESKQLIIFVNNALSNLTDCNISIVPHPLSKFNYENFLTEIYAPPHINISYDYNSTIEKCKYILFDSSTAGIEGLLNAKIPIRIANNYMLNVNPSEFDITFTKYVYNYEDLISIIVENPDVESTTDYQKTALKFYECNDLEVFEKVTNELKFLEK